MMQRYAWNRALPAAGGAASGVIEAAHASAAADALIGRGIIPLTIRESSGPGAGSDAGAVLRLLPRTPVRAQGGPVDLLIFSRQLNTLLRAGVPILRALMELQETATSEKMKTTLAEVRPGLESGIALSMSLAQHPRVFDHFYIALVRVGEMTGRLDEIFLRLFHHQEFELFMRQQVKSALRYPGFVVSAMVAAIERDQRDGDPGLRHRVPAGRRHAAAGHAHPAGHLALRSTYGGLLRAGGPGRQDGAAGLDRDTKAGAALGWLDAAGAGGRQDRAQGDAGAVRAQLLAVAEEWRADLAGAVGRRPDGGQPQHIARRISGMRDSVERGESVLRAAAMTGIFTPVVLQMRPWARKPAPLMNCSKRSATSTTTKSSTS